MELIQNLDLSQKNLKKRIKNSKLNKNKNTDLLVDYN